MKELFKIFIVAFSVLQICNYAQANEYYVPEAKLTIDLPSNYVWSVFQEYPPGILKEYDFLEETTPQIISVRIVENESTRQLKDISSAGKDNKKALNELKNVIISSREATHIQILDEDIEKIAYTTFFRFDFLNKQDYSLNNSPSYNRVLFTIRNGQFLFVKFIYLDEVTFHQNFQRDINVVDNIKFNDKVYIPEKVSTDYKEPNNVGNLNETTTNNKETTEKITPIDTKTSDTSTVNNISNQQKNNTNTTHVMVAITVFVIFIGVLIYLDRGLFDETSSSVDNLDNDNTDKKAPDIKKMSNDEYFNRVFPNIKRMDEKYGTTQGLVERLNQQTNAENKQPVMSKEEKYQHDLDQYRKQAGVYIPPKPIKKEETAKPVKYTKKDIENIKDWRLFEKFISGCFKERGYKTTLTSATNDGGKDIIVEKNGIKTYIECKYWQTGHSIGRELIQKLAGAAMMDGVKNAIFITTSSYHSNAYDAARKLKSNGFNIQLWDTDKLLKFINS